jgi:polar amino acid transport system substrate-binding protein
MRAVRLLAAVLLGMSLLSACSGGSSKKTLTFCTDPTYPPAESYSVGKVGTRELKRTLIGADIDIANAVAGKFDRSARFRDTAFSDIIPDLLSKDCDAAISFINDTAARRQQVSFVDYLAAGQTVMTKKSARTIRSLADLAGHTVAVAKDTTEEDFLKAQKADGATFRILSFSTEDDAIYAVQQGAAEVYFGDAPIVQAAVAHDKSLQIGAQLVKAIPIGIALRPGDSLLAKTRKAIKDLYADGSMGKILARWNMSSFAVAPSS